MRQFIFLTLIIVAIGGLIAGYRTLLPAPVVCGNLSELPNPPAFARNDDPVSERARTVDAPVPSCAQPSPANVSACLELEQRILASTVRLEWQHWRANQGVGYTHLARSIGYATIKEGRYLVTHNHPGFSLLDQNPGEFVTISVFSAADEPVWLYARLSTITIRLVNPETLILDFGDHGGTGLFAMKGLASAEFKGWESLPLRPGLEVAQIDWDGATAGVDWVTIDNVIMPGDGPKLELANFVRPGASGGGVFWQGYHIANTLSQVTVCDKRTGAVLRQYSVAILDSPQVTAPASTMALALP